VLDSEVHFKLGSVEDRSKAAMARAAENREKHLKELFHARKSKMDDYVDDLDDDAASADRGRRALSKSIKVTTRASADPRYFLGESSMSAERDDHEVIRL